MSERASFRYALEGDADDTTPVALPAMFNAVPSIIAPGDVFNVPEEHADTFERDPRFTRTRDDAPDPRRARFEALDVADLKAHLDGRDVEYAGNARKADLVALAVDAEASNPTPPGAPAHDSRALLDRPDAPDDVGAPEPPVGDEEQASASSEEPTA